MKKKLGNNYPDKNKSYDFFIKNFIENGYKFIKFKNTIKNKKEVILRHDIDFSCSYIEEIVNIENKYGVKSSFFFLVKSNFYNVFSYSNEKIIKNLMKDGHSVSIHFDPSIYKNMKIGFENEKKIFTDNYHTKIDCISLHRPSLEKLKTILKETNTKNTYEYRYFKKIKYFSDSCGKFRYGNPFDSESFKEKDSMQILIHPIWWVNNNTQLESPESILKNYIKTEHSLLKIEVRKNSNLHI